MTFIEDSMLRKRVSAGELAQRTAGQYARVETEGNSTSGGERTPVESGPTGNAPAARQKNENQRPSENKPFQKRDVKGKETFSIGKGKPKRAKRL